MDDDEYVIFKCLVEESTVDLHIMWQTDAALTLTSQKNKNNGDNNKDSFNIVVSMVMAVNNYQG